MDRRQFFHASGLIWASLGAAPTLLRASTKTYRWRLVMVIPKHLPIWGEGVLAFAEKVKLMTEGRLDIKVFGAGELVPALQTFEACSTGRVEMAHSAAYYWQGKLAPAVFFTSVPFGLPAQGMRAWLYGGDGQRLWDELYEPHGIFSLPAGNTGMQMGGWFRREINSVKDFSGLKMRIPGLGSKVIEKLGAKPMLVAGGEIYTNLATGVLDATEWVGPYHDYLLGLHKVAKFYYHPGWHEPGSVLELMISKKAWQELPLAYQEVVRTAASDLDATMNARWLAKDAEYLEKIKALGDVEIRAFPDDVLKKLKETSYEVQNEVGRTSPLAGRILQSFRQFQKGYEGLQHATLGAYLRALEGR